MLIWFNVLFRRVDDVSLEFRGSAGDEKEDVKNLTLLLNGWIVS